MKILKLEINNVRGIPHLEIEPKGKSLVVYGPNGTGKSAVIDAIDFLLTGKINRLVGDGTLDVSLKKHGPHITKAPKDVSVRASIQVHGIKESIDLYRCMDNPTVLVYDEKYAKVLAPLLDILNRGQHVFTRREVLKLITARSSDRSKSISEILKLENLEVKRAALVKVKNQFVSDAKTIKIEHTKSLSEIIAITGGTKFEAADVLNFVNDQRKKLNAQEITSLTSSILKEGVNRVAVNDTNLDHKALIERAGSLNAESLTSILSEVPQANAELIRLLAEIKSDPEADWNAKRFDFTKAGLQLVRESGECPLCDHGYSPGQLQEALQARIDAQKSRHSSITENADKIKSAAEQIKTRILHLSETIKPITRNEQAQVDPLIVRSKDALNDWWKNLESAIEIMAKPFQKYQPENFAEGQIDKLFAPTALQAELPAFVTQMQKLFPEATPEQVAWDNLTKLEERLKVMEDVELRLEKSTRLQIQGEALLETFVAARDEILESLYEKIKDRFVAFYKEMHGEDEDDFEAKFEADDKALNMNVDFYGHGFHPPHALHSEGHQDSMGVCLFLALSEHLNTGLVDIVALDDVVTSVDTGHRRAFCDVLVRNFPDHQFIITTHETAWANQLKSSGVVNGKQMLRFFNWEVGSGPRIHYEADMWNRIEKDLVSDEVDAASAKLRRGMEEFLRYVCNSLKAPVPYSLDDSGSLGDFIGPAIGRYNKLLEKAITAAKSWGKDDVVASLTTVTEAAKAIFKDFDAESGTVNKAVHFNQWANYSKEDFEPVVNAYKALYEKIFSCENAACQSVLYLSYNGANAEALRCKCGDTNWSLIKK